MMQRSVVRYLSSICLFLLGYLLFERLTLSSRRPDTFEPVQVSKVARLDELTLRVSPSIQAHALIILLPVTEESLTSFSKTIAEFLPAEPRHIILLCVEALTPIVEKALKTNVLSNDSSHYRHPEYTILPWNHVSTFTEAALHALVPFAGMDDWILLSDVHGLEGIEAYAQQKLIRPINITVPMGPKGESLTITYVFSFLLFFPPNS
ncbi:hypothetical protein VNI00_002737 [Paramarasmius palmivorus]|uniref:Uncharacterized protein n=1 Tax=Paramarasmius palmivorus TaxID=297713 RepID=A0AAW0DXP1_9AGAR